MNKLMKNKKGIAVDDFIPLMLTIIAFVIALMFFVFDNSAKADSIINSVDFTKEEITANDYLTTFLSTKSNLNILTEAYLSDDYNLFEERAKAFFDPIYSDAGNSWKLVINSEKNTFQINGKGYSSQFNAYILTKLSIPSPDKKTIKLIFYKQTPEALYADVAG